ncbi:MAG: OmpA family protein [Flavobacteriales bacterium]|nr:OmpA family protein [Flavobacteriales bacterium]
MENAKAIEGGDNQRAYYFVDGVSLSIHPEPDTDADGIPDKDDQCPNEAGLANLGGCPDRDGDGIADKLDACPDLAGPADKQGCPDRDGDGITDNVDRCPDVAGVATMKGCPELKEETKKLFEKALTGVKFESGKSVMKKESNSILDQVVVVMKENPSYNLEIHGHTDSQGDDAKNQKLSDDRAAAVKKYLTDKGVDESRVRSSGHGETMPVADNATSAGRAQEPPRRVQSGVLGIRNTRWDLEGRGEPLPSSFCTPHRPSDQCRPLSADPRTTNGWRTRGRSVCSRPVGQDHGRSSEGSLPRSKKADRFAQPGATSSPGPSGISTKSRAITIH